MVIDSPTSSRPFSAVNSLLRFAITVLLALILACNRQNDRYIENWDRLRVGMSKAEVTELLGGYSDACGPAEMDADTASSRATTDKLMDLIFADLLFDLSHERWHYGRFELGENILMPSEKAYVVYFDRRGRVVKWRKPIAKHGISMSISDVKYADIAATYELTQPAVFSGQEAFRAAVVAPSCVYALSRTGRLYVYEFRENKPQESGAPVTTIARVGDGHDLELIGDHLVFTNNGGLNVFSIADRHHPLKVSQIASSRPAHSETIARDGNRLFVIGFGRIGCYDVSDLMHPKLLFEHIAGHSWWTGCVIDNRLCTGEIKVDRGDFGVAKQREGVAIMSIENDGLHETGFVSVPAPFHVFALDNTHVLASLDAETHFHAGYGPHGRSVVIDISNPTQPLAGNINPNSGGRVAVMAHCSSGNLLICDGAVFPVHANRLSRRQDLRMHGSTLDGSPYHGKINGIWAALPQDRTLSILKLRCTTLKSPAVAKP